MTETENQEKELVEENNLPEKTEELSVDILNRIQNITTKEELDNVVNLFNLSITKKEMMRALQQNNLLDLILQQMQERIVKRPDEMPTKDLLDMMNAFKNSIERTQTYIDKVENSPAIQLNDNKKVIVNINTLSRDENENVINAINMILKSAGDKDTLEDLMDSVKIADIKEEGEETNDD